MSGWSPPSIPREWLVGIGVLYLALLVYALIIVQEVVVMAFFPAFLLASVYFLWRFIVAVEAIADALQRLAHNHEQE